MTEAAVKVEGITSEQLKRLRDGGWQDDFTNSPGWERHFGGVGEEGGYVRHWVFLGWDYPGEGDRWCASVGGSGPRDYNIDTWTDSLDKALGLCDPPPGLEMKPAERDCTYQAERFGDIVAARERRADRPVSRR